MKGWSIAAVAAVCLLDLPSSAKPQKAFPDLAAAGESPADYDRQVRAYFEENLKDPSSAIVKEARAPRRAAHRLDGGFRGRLWSDPAWWVCYKVNAKNSYGGYVGNHLYMFAFVNGQIAGAQDSPSPGYQGRDYDVPAVQHECSLPLDSSDGSDKVEGPDA